MKKKRKWIKWVILAAVVLLIVAWMMLFNKTTESVAYNRMTAQQGDLTTYYNFDGTVRAKRSQTIAAQAADTVKTVYVAQNARVKKDDRLYKTESGTTVRAGIDGEVTAFGSENALQWCCIDTAKMERYILILSDTQVIRLRCAQSISMEPSEMVSLAIGNP